MHLKRILLILLVIVYSSQLAHAGSEQDIIQGLQLNTGGTFTLPAGTYEIHSQIKMPENTILQGETDSSGKLLTKLVLASDLKLGEQVPVIETSSGCKILYIDFDGNSHNRPNVPAAGHSSGGVKQWGGGYDNFIGGKHLTNVRVAYCNFYNNLGDGFRFWYSSNIEFDHNAAAKGGHDVFYGTRSEGLYVHDNYVQPRSNSAFRIMDCSGVLIANNTVRYVREYDGVSYDAGPSIQIQNDNGEMDSIEVCYNTIYDSWGPGFWIVAKTNNGKQSANIHNNVMYDAGANHGIYWAAGMIISGYDNLKIDHNVFDGSYRGGVVYYAVNPGWATKANSDIAANIFTDTKPGASDNKGGYGVLNQISAQTVSSSENCYYNNPAGNVEGCSLSSSDLFSNPRETSTPSGYTWDGSHWSCPGMPPSSFSYVPGGVYNGSEDITPEEEDEFEWEHYFLGGVMDLEYPENAYTNQTEDQINYSVPLNDTGQIQGGVKIFFANVAVINNRSYIPDENSIVVKSEASPSPAYMYKGKITKNVETSLEDGIAHATMKVKMKYTKSKTDPKTQKKVKSTKTASATFTDSEKAPEVLEQPDKLKGILYVYPDHYELKVNPENYTIQDITYVIKGNTSKMIYMVGTQNKTDTGLKYTEYDNLKHWINEEGTIYHQGDWVIVNGVFNQEDVKVYGSGPYKKYPVEFEVTEKEMNGELFAWWLGPYMVLLLFFISGFAYIGFKLKQR